MIILGWIAIGILIFASIIKIVQALKKSNNTSEAIGVLVGMFINIGIVFLFIWFMYN